MTPTPDLRPHLLTALEADLIGPFQPAAGEEPAEEVLPLPPSRWYLTGFLAPQQGRDPRDPEADDEIGTGPDEDEEETAGSEPEPKRRNFLPASIGLSVLLPPGETTDTVIATVTFADYRVESLPAEEAGRPRQVWRRHAREPVRMEVPLDSQTLAAGLELPDSGGLRLSGKLTPAEAPGLPVGTRALALFLVNQRPVGEKGRQDEAFCFQVRLEIEHAGGLVPRPNRRDEDSDEWDARVADLQFRDCSEWAVGHGVSVEVPPQAHPVQRVATAWIPRAEVPRVITREEPRVETAMETLADLSGPAAVQHALGALPQAYAAWIVQQRRIEVDSDRRRETRDLLMDRAERAQRRIEEGIEVLARDPRALEAFQLANRAMAAAARRRNPERYLTGQVPRWRLFQLAFVLLNLAGLTDETHPDRETVELIFFPTGGGKTEAYLGVIALTLLLRRLEGLERADKGLGVAVLLRYTLRLLTLDQLARAATLVCALEILRREQPETLGEVRFAVGLWVGRTATANTLDEVKRRIMDYKNSPSKDAPSPFPLTDCPWCGHPLERDSLSLVPAVQPAEVVVGCLNFRSCEFSAAANPDGLPVIFVDEQVYRELPCFLVATVDKVAMLPWRGETGMLFGRVVGREGRRFTGPLDAPGRGEALPDGLRPPGLIVQDELHLISGPLGTLVGLYETAIEQLATRVGGDSGPLRPKLLAATATVRRAQQQIQALFGRDRVDVFPPPGPDDGETWFATTDREAPGRLYVGVAASGRAMKAILLRTYVALLAAAARLHDPRGEPDQPADAYMTLAGYFNSLRELGGMRRLVEDEVRTRAAKAEEKRPLDGAGPHPWVRNRPVQAEPVELTSREPVGRIKRSKARLGLPFNDPERVDVLLASNMISVGVDIDRLGLMVVAGQPKTTSEYIQASSRVGRRRDRPGLVVTCLNLHKPRDRSHYERFTAYHESFYRFVEVTSLTPFSGPALDRGLAGTLIAMVRLAGRELAAAGAAMELPRHREMAEAAVARLAERGGAQLGLDHDIHERLTREIRQRGLGLLDSWERLIDEAREAAARRAYSPFDLDRAAGKPLLRTVLDEEPAPPGSDEAKFVAPTSMRDVEPTVHLWLERRRLGGTG